MEPGRVARVGGAALATAGTVAVVVLALLVQLGGSADAAPARRTTSSTSTVASPARTFGVFLPGAPGDTAALSSFSTTVGRRPNLVMWFDAWSAGSDFPAQAAASVAAFGATPQITWEPWDPAAGVDQPAYALDRITDGSWDAYLTRWATEIKAYGKPVQLRFAHEMNGTWYPWAEGVNGNGPGDYVAAWDHVTGLFASLGVTNVQWIWSPNVPYPGSTPLAELFPGDAQVSGVALDGYNFGTTQTWSSWTTFSQLFSDGVGQLRSLSARPLTIAETASTEQGGSKATWVKAMFAALAQHPEVAGFTWFEATKETDWRVESSSSSLRAFRSGLAAY